MNKNFLGERIVVIIAHPDDESFGAAGTIYANRKAGGESAIICATRGERGKSHLRRQIDARELKVIRTKELKRASRFLGVRNLRILDFPDGKVKENKRKIYKKALLFTRRFEPDAILSFGPDGISGHLDHIAIGEISKRIAKDLSVHFYAFAAPPQLVRNIEQFKERRKFGVYSKIIRRLKPNLRIAVNSEVKIKTLRFHKSQFSEKDFSDSKMKKLMKKILKFEYFTRSPKPKNQSSSGSSRDVGSY